MHLGRIPDYDVVKFEVAVNVAGFVHFLKAVKDLEAQLDGSFLGERLVSCVEVLLKDLTVLLLDKIGPNLIVEPSVHCILVGNWLKRVSLALHIVLQCAVFDDEAAGGEALGDVVLFLGILGRVHNVCE